MAETNVIDRFEAWLADPDRTSDPTLLDAFAEGFTQAVEWISGQPRQREGQ